MAAGLVLEITGKLNKNKVIALFFSSPPAKGDWRNNGNYAHLRLPFAKYPHMPHLDNMFAVLDIRMIGRPELHLCSEYLCSPVCILAMRWQMFTSMVSACRRAAKISCFLCRRQLAHQSV